MTALTLRRTSFAFWPTVALAVAAWLVAWFISLPLANWVAFDLLGLQEGSQLGDAVRLKAQLLNSHACWATPNPRGDTGDFGGGDAGFVAPERLVHKMVLQRGHAVLQEKPVLRSCAAAQFDLAVKKSGFDGIVKSVGEAEFCLNSALR